MPHVIGINVQPHDLTCRVDPGGPGEGSAGDIYRRERRLSRDQWGSSQQQVKRDQGNDSQSPQFFNGCFHDFLLFNANLVASPSRIELSKSWLTAILTKLVIKKSRQRTGPGGTAAIAVTVDQPYAGLTGLGGNGEEKGP